MQSLEVLPRATARDDTIHLYWSLHRFDFGTPGVNAVLLNTPKTYTSQYKTSLLHCCVNILQWPINLALKKKS